MEQKIGIAKARESFSELVNRVAFGRERFLVERRGRPLAALISAQEYQQLLELLADTGVRDAVNGIPVWIRFDGERFFVCDEVVDEYGVGDSLEEAREDYRLAVQDYYADLSANCDRLTPRLQQHLTFLKGIFSRDEEGAAQ